MTPRGPIMLRDDDKDQSAARRESAPGPATIGGMTTGGVELHAVRMVYGSGLRSVVALDEVTATFTAGTFTAVMGPSGSGKSTLLHCAAGLERPTAGTVVVDGVALAGLAESTLTRMRRDRVGFVFQELNLVSSLTAAQNVGLPLRLAGRRPGPERIGGALAVVGLGDRAGHRPSELSGGEQQRVAIARALVTRPAVLFADEPTGALDTRASRQVLDLLRAVVDEHGHTVVMVTHDPVAAARADRVVLLADGRIVREMVGGSASAIAGTMAELEGASC
jgi:putative ABC transport system ATP-binding protein